MVSIIEIPDDPKFTIKSVCDQTGMRAVTLRAWERRYAILNPHRADNRYRLYSARDVEILRWIKARMDQGISISNAANEFHTMVRNGIWPDALPTAPNVVDEKQSLTPPQEFVSRLYDALLHHDEDQASVLLRKAQSLFNLETLLIDVITPCLVQIGEAWYYGKILIATEHFASAFFRGKLLSLLQAYPARRSAPYILVGCAPNESHEIGSLMMAVLLRSQGYRIEYLGPDIPVNDMVEYAGDEKPDLIIITATSRETAMELINVERLIQNIQPKPIFGFGGRIFWMDQNIQQKIAGTYLGDSLSDGVAKANMLLKKESVNRTD